MLDFRQTPEYAKYMESIGWIVKRKNGVNYFIKKFPLIGAFIKIQRPEKIDINCIHELIHEYKAFKIIIEPKNSYSKPVIKLIKRYGYSQNRSPFVPTKTIHIDLRKSERQLLSEMHYKTRYNIKKSSQNLSIKTQISNDIEKFSEFWQMCAIKQRGMFLSQKRLITKLYKAFGKKAYLLLVFNLLRNKEGYSVIPKINLEPNMFDKEIPGRILSAILMVRTKDVAYYTYAASTKEGKKLFAPTLNVWEAIRLAKKLGCKIFDFEGIYDDRFPLKSWLGFTRFKKSFGGREIKYPGAFVKYKYPWEIKV